MTETRNTILPDLGGHSENYCFRSGLVLNPPHITDTAPDTYSLDVVRYHENGDGSLRFEHLELMRMQGEDGHAYMGDATEKFNRMLAEVGPERTERAAKTWGRLHGAHIQDWREINEDDLLPERAQPPKFHDHGIA
jgi:hypothetical protein